jgi:hypothetical protein
MPPYDENLTNLDEWIRRLKVEYAIFFNGNRKKPPDDLRMRVERLVKRLAETSDMSFSDRFRYNTLIARYYVFRDLWRRTQQGLESADEAHEPLTPKQTPPLEPQTCVLREEVQVTISDPAAEAAKVRHLYDELLRMRREHAQNAPAVSFEQFANYIAGQIQGIQEKHRCTNVVFRIEREAKAVRFTAKANISSSG